MKNIFFCLYKKGCISAITSYWSSNGLCIYYLQLLCVSSAIVQQLLNCAVSPHYFPVKAALTSSLGTHGGVFPSSDSAPTAHRSRTAGDTENENFSSNKYTFPELLEIYWKITSETGIDYLILKKIQHKQISKFEKKAQSNTVMRTNELMC